VLNATYGHAWGSTAAAGEIVVIGNGKMVYRFAHSATRRTARGIRPRGDRTVQVPTGVMTLLSRVLPALAVVLIPATLMASDDMAAFYDGALCSPPYTMQSATELYDAAEKLTKPDTSLLTAYVYKLPSDIGRDGFKTSEVVFAGSSVGVLIEGARADDLAARYQLQPEKSSILGTSTKGFARALADAEQPTAEMGIVSIVARESDAIPGKTLLACEFVSHADLEALKAVEGAN